MEFSIKYEEIIKLVEEEVSREGAQAYSDDGSSLYDGIRIISRDEDKMKRLMQDVLVAVKMLCNRFVRHIAVIDLTSEPLSFYFELELSPRRSVGKEQSLKTAFRSIAVNLMLNKYFTSKNLTELASKYDALALADVQAMTKLLYEKLPPVYPTIV